MKFVQCCFAATLCRSGGGEGRGESGDGGACCVPPCSPSALTQIVPISASIYTVFHSVIFNSVVKCKQLWVIYSLAASIPLISEMCFGLKATVKNFSLKLAPSGNVITQKKFHYLIFTLISMESKFILFIFSY